MMMTRRFKEGEKIRVSTKFISGETGIIRSIQQRADGGTWYLVKLDKSGEEFLFESSELSRVRLDSSPTQATA